MLKKYRNQIADIFKTLDFPITDFDFFTEHEGLGTITYIKHKGHPFYFGILESKSDFNSFKYKFIRFAPGFPESSYIPESVWQFYEFNRVLTGFQEWLQRDLVSYLEEIETPDLLDAMMSSNESFALNVIDFNSTDPFNQEERHLLKQGLEELKILAEDSLKLTAAEFNILNSRIDYLEEASERMNKVDWKGLVMGTIISIITTLTLDVEKGKLLYELFSKVLTSIPKLH